MSHRSSHKVHRPTRVVATSDLVRSEPVNGKYITEIQIRVERDKNEIKPITIWSVKRETGSFVYNGSCKHMASAQAKVDKWLQQVII